MLIKGIQNKINFRKKSSKKREKIFSATIRYLVRGKLLLQLVTKLRIERLILGKLIKVCVISLFRLNFNFSSKTEKLRLLLMLRGR